MPKKDYVSVTLRKVVYDEHKQRFLDNKDNLAKKGILSFSAYVTYILYNARLPEEEQQLQ